MKNKNISFFILLVTFLLIIVYVSCRTIKNTDILIGMYVDSCRYTTYAEYISIKKDENNNLIFVKLSDNKKEISRGNVQLKRKKIILNSFMKKEDLQEIIFKENYDSTVQGIKIFLDTLTCTDLFVPVIIYKNSDTISACLFNFSDFFVCYRPLKKGDYDGLGYFDYIYKIKNENNNVFVLQNCDLVNCYVVFDNVIFRIKYTKENIILNHKYKISNPDKKKFSNLVKMMREGQYLTIEQKILCDKKNNKLNKIYCRARFFMKNLFMYIRKNMTIKTNYVKKRE